MNSQFFQNTTLRVVILLMLLMLAATQRQTDIGGLEGRRRT
jgi:hypothetical protein